MLNTQRDKLSKTCSITTKRVTFFDLKFADSSRCNDIMSLQQEFKYLFLLSLPVLYSVGK